ncbi:MAG: nucleoside-binding protein [Gemmatimonadota bacterium]|nr:nucleoside-binding protein [Gemmatimonadota bacterium]
MKRNAYSGLRRIAAVAVMSIAAAYTSAAAPQTEFHLKAGKLRNPFAQKSVQSLVLNVQQASQWKLGDSFFFINYLTDRETDGFNDRDFYGEWYPTLSIGKMQQSDASLGIVSDLAIIAGINMAGDAKVFKLLPGLRVSWDIPGFLFLNTDLTAYIDRNFGVAKGGAPKEGHSFMFDVNWAAPFGIGNQSFGISGHAEYIGSRSNELGGRYGASILAQPQFVWDIGRAAAGEPNQLLLGFEYQYWRNKLGTDDDETTIQFLVVWRL